MLLEGQETGRVFTCFQSLWAQAGAAGTWDQDQRIVFGKVCSRSVTPIWWGWVILEWFSWNKPITAQKWCCAQEEVLSSTGVDLLLFYSSWVSPASAFGHAGTSASHRQPEEPERIWGDTDHQGNEANKGKTRVEIRAESSDGRLLPSQRDAAVFLRSSPTAPTILFCLLSIQQLFSLLLLHHH